MTSRYSSAPRSGGSPSRTTGSPASSTRRGKSNLSSNSGDAYVDELQVEDGAAPLVSRKLFDDMRKETLDDTISEAGSDDEEAIPLDEADQHADEPSTSRKAAEQDLLSRLKADTPLKKLRSNERIARKSFEAGDLWTALQLRQEILGLAKLYAPRGVYGQDNKFPMLVPDAHFKLAKVYAELGCVAQANDHCNRALETMPMFGLSHEQVAAFKQDTNIMLGEMLLMAKPPKPQAALQYMYSAAEVNSSEGIKDLGIKVLAAQCHMLMGTSKMQEASAARSAHEALEQRVVSLMAKLGEITRRSPEYARVETRIAETRNELSEEEGFEALLIEEARVQLEQACDLLMEVIAEEEGRMSSRVANSKKHPLLTMLWRQACEILFKLSMVEGLSGNNRAQLVRLGEINSAQVTYGCVSAGLQARVLKEQGAALVAKSNTAHEEDRMADLKEALAVYNDLLQLQNDRYIDDVAKQALARADTLKLIGNVYIAMRQWNRAQEHFQQALDIFASYLGPEDLMVQDLEHRMNEVQSYLNE